MLNYYEQKKVKKQRSKKGKGIFNKVVLRQQFKENFKSLLTMTLIVSALMVLVLALWPLVEGMFEGLNQETIDLLAMFGGVPENIAEFFAVEAGQFYVLIGAIYAAILGMNLIKKEIDNGSSEFLYSQPIQKSTIFRTKLIALVINLLIFNVVVTSLSLATIFIVEGEFAFNLAYFLLFCLTSFIIHLQIGVFVFSITAIIKKSASIGIGIGLVVFTYFLAFIAKMASEAEFFKYITPFSYIFPPSKTEGETLSIVRDGFGVVNTPTLIGISIVVVLTLFYAHRHFRKNDIV